MRIEDCEYRLVIESWRVVLEENRKQICVVEVSGADSVVEALTSDEIGATIGLAVANLHRAAMKAKDPYR